MTFRAILFLLSVLSCLLGTLLFVVGRRMAGYLTSRPMHSEGDALFVYCTGAGVLGWVLGIALATLGFFIHL